MLSKISRLSSGPPGRRHSLLQPPDPQMGKRSQMELQEVLESEHSTENFQVAFNPDTAEDGHSSNSPTDDDNNNFILKFNIGGRIFHVYHRTLMAKPGTKLAVIANTTRNSDPGGSREIFFDRNPDMFEAILSLYRNDTLHAPRHVCVIAFCKELEFWGLNETWLSDCCQKLYNDAVGEMQLAEMMKKEFDNIHPRRAISRPSFILTRRGKLWEFLDNPQSSVGAKVWFFCFYLFLVISVVNVFVSTHPNCRVPITNNHTVNHATNDFLGHQAENNPKIRRLLTTRPHTAVVVLELLCAVYFTVEFLLRVLVCPHKRALFRSLLTWCDLLYLIPLWCQLIISSVEIHLWMQPRMLPGALVLKTLMVFRVLRIFILAKHYRALRILLLSIKASLREILLLFIFVMFTMIVYASLVYCAEIFNTDSQFDTLFTGLWWSLITMTTVGYGDVVPKSWAGYIIASACALTGIIIIGMPVPIITSNFHLYYGFQAQDDDEEVEVPRVKPKAKANTLQSKAMKGNG